MNKRNTRKWLLSVAVFVLALFSLMGCGGGGGSKSKEPAVKDYAGYYTLTWDGRYNIAMQILPDGTVTYMNENSGNHRGTLEIEDDEAVIYLVKEYSDGDEVNSSYSKYCPLTLKLLDDGKQGRLSSEHENWTADNFDVVDKETFERFIDEESTGLVVYNGKEWQTLADRNPAYAAQQEEEQQAEAEARELERDKDRLMDNIAGVLEEYEYMSEEMDKEEYLEMLMDLGDPELIVIANHFDEIIRNGGTWDDNANWTYNGDFETLLEEYRQLKNQ